jgi:hypothetical protein
MLGFMTKNGKKDKVVDEKTGDAAVGVMPVVKVIELIGTSNESFDDAIRGAVALASKSLRGIRGADVKHMTVGIRDGEVQQYRVALKVAFAIDDDEEDDDDKDDD